MDHGGQVSRKSPKNDIPRSSWRIQTSDGEDIPLDAFDQDLAGLVDLSKAFSDQGRACRFVRQLANAPPTRWSRADAVGGA